MGRSSHRNGFTIIELLVTIIVIAILAAITIVAYNGIQARARLTVAQTEMAELGKQAAIYHSDYGTYPIDESGIQAILKSSGLYASTRTTAKSYGICTSSSGYVFVAWEPVVTTYKNGDTLYIYSSSGGQKSYTLTNSSVSSYPNQIDKVCDQVKSDRSFEAWTYTIP